MKDSSTQRENKLIKKIAAIVFWVIIWQIASMIISEEVLLVSPLRVFNRLLELLPEMYFLEINFFDPLENYRRTNFGSANWYQFILFQL